MNNKKDDILIKVFRDRLGDHKHPVGKDIWSNIEAELTEPDKIVPLKSSRSLWLWIGSVAACLLIALSIGLFLHTHQNASPSKELHALKIEKKALTEKTELPKDSRDSRNSYTVETPKPTKAFKVFKSPVSSKASKSPAASETPEAPKAPKTTEALEAKKNQEIKEAPDAQALFATNDEEPEHWIANKKKKHRGLSYALAMNSSPTSNGNANEADPILRSDVYFESLVSNYPFSSVTKAMQSYNETTVVDEKYDFPLSFSLLGRYSFNNRWALESGLTYTYLHSEISTISSQTDIRLNYLGIPIKGVCSLYDNGTVSFYLTAGGMGEYCIYGDKKISSATGKTQKLNIPEIQWSVAGSAGANIKIAPKINLFVEPGVSHYFNDGSEVMTYRKDKPTTFTLQAGIRLNVNN